MTDRTLPHDHGDEVRGDDPYACTVGHARTHGLAGLPHMPLTRALLHRDRHDKAGR